MQNKEASRSFSTQLTAVAVLVTKICTILSITVSTHVLVYVAFGVTVVVVAVIIIIIIIIIIVVVVVCCCSTCCLFLTTTYTPLHSLHSLALNAAPEYDLAAGNFNNYIVRIVLLAVAIAVVV